MIEFKIEMRWQIYFYMYFIIDSLLSDNLNHVEVKSGTRWESLKTEKFNQIKLHHLQQGGKLELCLISFQPGQCILEVYGIIEMQKEGSQDDEKNHVACSLKRKRDIRGNIMPLLKLKFNNQIKGELNVKYGIYVN